MGLITISHQEGHGKCDRVCDMESVTGCVTCGWKQMPVQNRTLREITWNPRRKKQPGGEVNYQMSWKKSEGPELPKINLSN